MQKNLISFIWYFIRAQRVKFFLIAILSLIWSFDMTFWPYLLGAIVDSLTAYEMDRDNAWGAIQGLLFLGAFFWVFVELCFRTRDFLFARFAPKFEAQIRMAMFDHIQRHSPRYFHEHFAGNLANKTSDMSMQASLLIRNTLTFFIPAIVGCIATVLVFIQVNAIFAAILGVWIIAHFTICGLFTPKCAHYSYVHGEARSSLVGRIVDSFTNHFAVNLFFRFRFEKQRIATFQVKEQETNQKAQQYTALMFAMLSLGFAVGGIVLNGVMVSSWLKGKISTGEMVQVFNTTWQVLFSMWWCADMAPQTFQAIGIAKQALTIMRDPQDVLDTPGATSLAVQRGEIVFENVSFQYGEEQLFTNLNLSIQGGEKVGLVGYSGAGKSTFVNLLFRFYPIQSGRILIDGQDIAQVTLESLRTQLSLIPQEPLLFHRTLEENIAYGSPSATSEEVRAAGKLAHCDEFIKRTPGGYSAEIGERGAKLSGGERQRIAIARAMLMKAPILVLDEATSALDSVTETYIQKSFETLMENRTTIVIAHRLSTLSKMDRILVFDQGEIVEQGSHEALIASGGHYARMWEMQAGGFLPEASRVSADPATV